MSKRFSKRHLEPLAEVYEGVYKTGQAPICPYCDERTKLVKGNYIYPSREDLAQKNFWLCEPCNAYVGCHRDTSNALGTPADQDLRAFRSATHRVFDKIWKMGLMTRLGAYTWLANQLDIPKKMCHIALFDSDMCEAVAKLADAKLESYLEDLKKEPIQTKELTVYNLNLNKMI